MMHLLAETAPDAMISGNWIIGVIGALAAGVALVIGKKQGREEAQERDVTIKHPVPTVRTMPEPEFVTMDTFNGHLQRIESAFDEIKESLNSERGAAKTDNINIHQRIDKLAERLGDRLGSVEGTLRGIEITTSKLLDLALTAKKTSATR